MNGRSVAAGGLALLPLAAYIIWCVCGFNRLGQASTIESPWLASRALARGHQLVADDVVRAPDSELEHPLQSLDQLVGRYLDKDVPKNAPVLLADLLARPIIDPAPNSLIYFAPLDGHPELRPYLDVGSRLTLCWGEEKPCIHDRRVISVSCDDKDGCVVITTIPANDAHRVNSRDQLRLLVHR